MYGLVLVESLGGSSLLQRAVWVLLDLLGVFLSVDFCGQVKLLCSREVVLLILDLMMYW